MAESLWSAENRGTEYGRKLIQRVTTQKLILGAGSDTMSDQAVTPQHKFICVLHSFRLVFIIYKRERLFTSSLDDCSYYLLFIYIIFTQS